MSARLYQPLGPYAALAHPSSPEWGKGSFLLASLDETTRFPAHLSQWVCAVEAFLAHLLFLFQFWIVLLVVSRTCKMRSCAVVFNVQTLSEKKPFLPLSNFYDERLCFPSTLTISNASRRRIRWLPLISAIS